MDRVSVVPSTEELKEPHALKGPQPPESPIRDARSSKAMMDECLALLQQIDPSISLNMTTRKAKDGNFTGLLVGGEPHDFILFNPRKTMPLRVRVKIVAIEKANQWRERLKAAGFTLIPCSEAKRARDPETEQRKVRFSLPREQFNANLLMDLFRESYKDCGF